MQSTSAPSLALLDAGLEGQQVAVHKVPPRDGGRKVVPRVRLPALGRVLHAVGRVVLAARRRLDVCAAVLGRPLHPRHKRLSVLSNQIRVLARHLDVAPPPRLACEVDDRRPEARPGLACVHQRPRLVPNLPPREPPEGPVEGHACRNGVGELGGLLAARDAGRGLLPPVVRAQAKRLDLYARRVQVGDLFVERHAAKHVGDAFVDAERRVTPWLFVIRRGSIDARVVLPRGGR